MEYLAPGLIILLGNLFSGRPGSGRWELVTACYGFGCVASALLYLTGLWGSPEWANKYLLPIAWLCLIQALTRDYERTLKPFFDRLFGDKDE